MWTALANATLPVAPGGKLFIAIYNYQGTASRRWTAVKRLYNHSSAPVRYALLGLSFWVLNWRSLVKDTLRGRPFHSIRTYGKGRRGMSFWRDLVDWVGGYPFEVARPEEIFDFYRRRGFRLTALVTCGGSLGCNEFVLQREV
jgi:2-polyprenyl-6-hydroxyphenyl methylase/3-demethylubiquinone-9 3-methyltransferase